MKKTKKDRKYSGLELSLTTGSRRKQTLSNCLTLRQPGERADVSMNLTLRQARALRKFLDSYLG